MRGRMQEVASPASWQSLPRQSLPKSLMQRLALVSNGQLLPVPIESSKRQTASSFVALAWFGVGAMTSAVLGGVAFLGLQALAVGDRRAEVDRPVTAAARPEGAPARPTRYIFDVAIDRSEREHAPFGLQLTGTADDSMKVVLRGIPANARLNRGERRGARTWVVKHRDLDDLYLTLGDATPDAFNVRIDVLTPPPDVPTIGSLVRVRLVDKASPPQPAIAAGGKRPADRRTKSVASTSAVAGLAPAYVPAASRASDTADRQPPAPAQRRAAPAAADARVAASQSAPSARQWPEGASALGAIPRSERQL